MSDEPSDDTRFSLERRSKPEAAAYAVEQLDPATRVALCEYAIRMGLGPHFATGGHAEARDVDLSPKDLGALLSIRFDGRDDPVQDDLYTELTEWYRERQADVLPPKCPHCGCEWYQVRVRWRGRGPTDHATPVECDNCGLEIEPEVEHGVGDDI